MKKGEDRFLVCEDLRALFLDDRKELLVLPMPKPGAITATFTVFDGHVDNSASSFCEQRVVGTLEVSGGETDEVQERFERPREHKREGGERHTRE